MPGEQAAPGCGRAACRGRDRSAACRVSAQGGDIVRLSSSSTRRAARWAATSCCSTTATRHQYAAVIGPDRRGLPTTRRCSSCRRAAPEGRRERRGAASAGAQQNGVQVTKVMRLRAAIPDRRVLRDPPTVRPGAGAARLLPAHPRRQSGRAGRGLRRAGPSRARPSTPMPPSSRRSPSSTSPTARQVREDGQRRLGGDGAALLRRRLAAGAGPAARGISRVRWATTCSRRA